MEISCHEQSGFTPFRLCIQVETEEEARGLHAIFNYVPNGELLPYEAKKSLHSILEKYGEVGKDGIIANGVSYRKFYRPKA